jgi:hypothetical protein
VGPENTFIVLVDTSGKSELLSVSHSVVRNTLSAKRLCWLVLVRFWVLE